MERRLNILYRGPLSSCNYSCPYCPFAKRHETAAQLKVDKDCLDRFVSWVCQASRRIGVLFTPWGEALTRRWYRDTLIRLSHEAHVERVAAQTNLAADLDWVTEADTDKLALWCTYHPGEVSRDDFLSQCQQLDKEGVRYSVGVVGLLEHAAEIRGLREQLLPSVYLWVNAYKRELDYYDQDATQFLTQIDPLFPINNRRHPSLGKPCQTGQSAISVDGDGEIRRCHFVTERLGNLYEDDLDSILVPRNCPQATCGCHIGYVHLEELGLNDVFGEGILERIPGSFS